MPHNRAGVQPASQVCYCHDKGMHSVRVVGFGKALGLSLRPLFGVRVLTILALHR